jgi:accessory colonization factor AcfC
LGFPALLAAALFGVGTAAASMVGPVEHLLAYSPGGTHHVLVECAALFEKSHGVKVDVLKASPAEASWRFREEGDLFFGGAEYMVGDFVRRNPGVLNTRTVENLYARRIGIVVRKGNPLDIRGLESLRREDVDLLAVQLERMARFHPVDSERGEGVSRMVYTGQEGVAAWRSTPALDAWVTYKSWHVDLRGETDFVEVPGDDALRYTQVALTHRTPHRQAAREFVAFLKSPEARQVFVEHGWE